MKKSLAIILALIFVMSLAGTALAAPANPFVDVPAKHWAYDAVAKLAKAGIVDGYGDGTFRGDRTTTRYEMAQVVAKAMARSDKADAELKALIDKLAVEFASELNNLGVRVAKLEEKTRIGWNFESRIRYAGNDMKNTSGTDKFDWRQRIILGGEVNENVTYGARLVTSNNKFGATGAQTLGFDQAYFNVQNFMGAIDSLTVGRLDTRGVTNGLLNGKDANNDGIKIAKKFGDTTFTAMVTDQMANSEFYLYNLDFKPSDNLKLNVGYQTANFGSYSDGSITWFAAETKSADVGAQLKMGDFYLTGEYVSTKYHVPNGLDITWKSYAVQLTNGITGYLYPTYNLVDPKKAHTDAFAISYRKIEDNSVPMMSAFRGSAPVLASSVLDSAGVKGYFFTYQNVISKNVVWTAEYQDLKFAPASHSSWGYGKDKVWNTSFQFFF